MQEVWRGRELARALQAELSQHARELSRRLGRNPCVAIVAGDDSTSRQFVEAQRDGLAGLHLDIMPFILDSTCPTNAAVNLVSELNERRDVDAILLRHRLPDGINMAAVGDAIVLAKDVDGVSLEASARFEDGSSAYAPLAARAAYHLLLDELGSLNIWHVVIIGRDAAFANPLATLLRRAKADVTVVDPVDAASALRGGDADIVVLGGALPDRSALDHIEWLTLLLDAGYEMQRRSSSWLHPSHTRRIARYFGQYGNVGPLTIAYLAQSTLKTAASQLQMRQRLGPPVPARFHAQRN